MHKGTWTDGAQPGVKMASADQEKQIHLPSDQSLGREKSGSSRARDGPDPTALLLIPHEPKTFFRSDRESAGRDDHGSHTCEVPQEASTAERIVGARKPRCVPWFCLPHGGTVNLMLFPSLHLYNGNTLSDAQVKRRQKTQRNL